MPFWRTSAEWERVRGCSGRGSARFRITEFPVGLCQSLKSCALSSRCEWAQTKASAFLGVSTAMSLVNRAKARGGQSWDLDIQRKCCACKWLPKLALQKKASKQTNKQANPPWFAVCIGICSINIIPPWMISSHSDARVLVHRVKEWTSQCSR